VGVYGFFLLSFCVGPTVKFIFYVLHFVYKVQHMSATITVRVSRNLKEKMKKLPIRWSEELRGFLEERIRHLELAETIKDVESKAERRRLKVDSTKLIREDRRRQA